MDFTHLKVKTCFVCRAIGRTCDIRRSSNQLTYHNVDTYKSLYTSYLTFGFANAETLPLSLGVLDDISPTSDPARKDFIDYESGCWKYWKEDHAGCRPETTSNVHNLVVVDCDINTRSFRL
jgi:hypothetical protein